MDETELKVVPFKKKEEPKVEEKEELTPEEVFSKYITKSEAKEIIICGINEDGHLSYVTNMTDLPTICFAIDTVKHDLMH